MACSDSMRFRSELAQGEPENLRGVAKLFKDSKFYNDYAKYWLQDTSGPNSLLKLYQTLKEEHEQGELKERLEREHYNKMQQQHARVLAMKQQLGQELTKALQVEKCEEILETEAKTILDKWQADVDSLKAMKATLEPQVDKARKAQGRAKQDILDLHEVLRKKIPASLLVLSEYTSRGGRGAGGNTFFNTSAAASRLSLRSNRHSIS